ncbi:MAG: sigma 54-interacting transcriptional regulator [Deltaproteobacteria bacterium]|nr:sigma 54-interacting transcriptional regulator [Deltaproteobacteria bacterium]
MAKDAKFKVYANHEDTKRALSDLPIEFHKDLSDVREGTLAVVVRYLSANQKGTNEDVTQVIGQVEGLNVPVIILDDKLVPDHSRDVWLRRNVIRYLPLDHPDTAWSEVKRLLKTRMKYQKSSAVLKKDQVNEVGWSVQIPPDKFGDFNLISLFIGSMGDFLVDLKLMLDAIRPEKLDDNPTKNKDLDLTKALEFEWALRHHKDKHTYEGTETKKQEMEGYLKNKGGKELFDKKPSASNRNHIILEGETGTGKTLIARFIHDYVYQKFKSHTNLGELRTVSCANLGERISDTQLFGSIKGSYTDAITRAGAILEAFNGTVFLDEIGELTPELQSRLLHYLESELIFPTGWTRKGIYVPTFIVAATNRKLAEEVERGTFRRDLHHRLGFTVTIPPLRERIGDLERLVDFVLQNPKINPKRGKKPRAVGAIEKAAIEILRDHRFPGNFRELEQIIRRSVVRAMSYGVEAITADIVKESLKPRS